VTWTPDAPRFRLLDGPSPLQRLARFAGALRGGNDLEIWIKREDLLPLAFGGNKVRNLEFLIGAALAEGADCLVTSGRRWSNHCRLTAAAGARAGLEVHLVLTGPPLDEPGPNERLELLMGARLHSTATGDRAERAAMVEALVASLRSAGRRPYVIDVGGTGATGALGQVLAGREIAGQAAALSISPEAIIVPTATGGTQAGLMVGLALAGVETAVVGVAVAHPAATVWPGVVRLAGELGGLAGLGAGWRPEVRIEDTRPVADYGRHDPAADEATALLARTEGILVDPIYTAKALAWLVAQVRDGVFAGRTVVFWHAGGTPGLFESLEPARAL
jgi:1-aminocyclopropane-1-carboxylate deaminase/D-cysteine desulfhydrase-like pyridoxal-dependent ACC family enzyme